MKKQLENGSIKTKKTMYSLPQWVKSGYTMLPSIWKDKLYNTVRELIAFNRSDKTIKGWFLYSNFPTTDAKKLSAIMISSLASILEAYSVFIVSRATETATEIEKILFNYQDIEED